MRLLVIVIGVFSALIFTQGAGAQRQFIEKVEGLFTDLIKQFSIPSCIKISREQIKAATCSASDYAKALINLYTQECDLGFGKKFYSVLNKNMREDSQDEIWRRTGELINIALDILKPQKIDEYVYRGCTGIIEVPEKGQTYSFKQITSTSLRSDVACGFSEHGQGTRFTIKNAYGVSVAEFSAVKGEDEVLMKSTEMFIVESKVGNDVSLVRKASRRKKRSPEYQSSSNICISSDAVSTESNIQLRLLVLFLLLLYVS